MRQSREWAPTGFGDCQMRLEVEGAWTLAWLPAGDLDSSMTTFEIVEDSCRTDEFEYGPEHVDALVVERADQVTIMLVAAPLPPAPVAADGDVDAICFLPSNPVMLTVELDEAIGDRRVFSGTGELIYQRGE